MMFSASIVESECGVDVGKTTVWRPVVTASKLIALYFFNSLGTVPLRLVCLMMRGRLFVIIMLT